MRVKFNKREKQMGEIEKIIDIKSEKLKDETIIINTNLRN